MAMVPASPSPPPARSPPPPIKAELPTQAVSGMPNLFRRDDEESGGYHVSLQHRLQLVRALNGTGNPSAARTGLLNAWHSPVAFWIDRKAAIRGSGGVAGAGGMVSGSSASAESLLRDAAGAPGEKKPLVVLVLHALPNRDCQAAGAASSAICCHYVPLGGGATACDFKNGEKGNCDVGIDEYKSEVIDPLVALLREYEERVPIAFILEPSYSSLALGTSAPKCSDATTRHAYEVGVAYAVQQLSAAAPHVALYLGASDGGRLGWGERVRSFVTQVSRLGPLASKLRGFATNIGRYQPLGVACPTDTGEMLSAYCAKHSRDPCCSDRCGLIARFNSGVGELNYVQFLAKHMKIALPGFQPKFIVDTARAGVEPSGESCQDTCNGRSAGLGRRPSSKTALPELVDAYFWLFPPGFSDGCADCGARSDPACARDGALGTRPQELAAPYAGNFYPPLLRQLAAQTAQDDLAFTNGPGMTQASVEAAALARTVGISIPVDANSNGVGVLLLPICLLIAATGLVSFATRLRGARSPVTIDTPFDDEEEITDIDYDDGGSCRKKASKPKEKPSSKGNGEQVTMTTPADSEEGASLISEAVAADLHLERSAAKRADPEAANVYEMVD